MIRIVRFLVAVIALDACGQRAIEATLADWRHELARATTTHCRLVIDVRSLFGVARTLANVGSAEFRSASGSPFVWKLAGIVLLWGIWMLRDGAPGSTDRFFLVTAQTKAWTLVAVSLMPPFLAVFPLMVFLAEAVGRRHRVTPVMGTVVLLTSLGLLTGLVLFPASWTYLRYETWRHFANASVPEPNVSALFLSTVSVVGTTLAMVGIWVLFVFANRIRRVGGVTGWAIGLGVVLVAYVAGVLLRIQAVPIDVRIALMLSRPLLMLAAILWATHRLARIEAARSTAQCVAGL